MAGGVIFGVYIKCSLIYFVLGNAVAETELCFNPEGDAFECRALSCGLPSLLGKSFGCQQIHICDTRVMRSGICLTIPPLSASWILLYWDATTDATQLSSDLNSPLSYPGGANQRHQSRSPIRDHVVFNFFQPLQRIMDICFQGSSFYFSFEFFL